MNFKININSSNANVRKIFNFVIGNNYTKFVSLSQLRKDVKLYLEKDSRLSNKAKIRQLKQLIFDLKGFDFFEKSNYTSDVDYNTMSILSNFKDEVINYIEYNYLDINKERKLIRLVSPPLDAYKFKDFINNSPESFGYLFE